MGPALLRALLVGSIASASACAAREARPAHADAAAQQPTDSEQVRSRYREMTWAEYYAQVTERVWRRGGTVLWISPPNVRKGKRAAAQRD